MILAKNTSTPPPERRRAELSQWDTDGGAGPLGPQEDLTSGDDATSGNMQPAEPDLGNVELVQMRVRIIALENLVLALLAGATIAQLEMAREVSAYISPRPGFHPHPLTLQAATHIDHLIDRAAQFRANI